MHTAFEGVSVAGVIEPGQVYILCCESRRGFPAESIESTFTVRSEHEILEALDMEMNIVLADWIELRKFLNIQKIGDNCHEFRMLCYDKESEHRIVYSLYLHRIRSFTEELYRISKLFLDIDDEDDD
jgi:small nuclear ribonucleoprotein (snRNP)-like protein